MDDSSATPAVDTSAFAHNALGLDRRLVKAIQKLGFIHPTPVQQQALPVCLAGKDCIVKARTGSGKTLAYALAVLQRLLQRKADTAGDASTPVLRAVVLLPTRELVDQTAAVFSSLTYYCKDVVSVTAVGGSSAAAGGASSSVAAGAGIKRKGGAAGTASVILADVLIGTAGKVRSLCVGGGGAAPSSAFVGTGGKPKTGAAAAAAALGAAAVAPALASVDLLVLDEADLLTSYGYAEDVKAIAAAVPRARCQSILLSATLPPQLDELRRIALNRPVVVKVDEGAGGAGSGLGGLGGHLSQFYIRVGTSDRFLLLYALIKLRLIAGKALFFVNSVPTAYKLKLFLERFSINSAVLNAELPANSRAHILASFNRGVFDYLIATDASLAREGQGSDAEGAGAAAAAPGADAAEEEVGESEAEGGSDEDEAEEAEDSAEDEEDDAASDDDGSDADDAPATGSRRGRAAAGAGVGHKRRRPVSASDDDDEEEEEDEDEEEEAEGEGEDEDEDGSDDEDAAEDGEEGSEADSGSEASAEDSGAGRKGKQAAAAAAASAGSSSGKAGKGRRAGKKQQRRRGAGAEDEDEEDAFGVSRGIDFKGVTTVINFDAPQSAAAYTHRIGRTARGGASGVALTFMPPEGVEGRQDALLATLQATQAPDAASGAPQPAPLPFDVGEVEGFRYRVEDVLRSVTDARVREARAAELRHELAASAALAAHFEDNPADLAALLRHDRHLAPKAVKPHLRDVPSYLLPASLRAAVEAAGGGVGAGRRGGKAKAKRARMEDAAAAAAGPGGEGSRGAAAMGGGRRADPTSLAEAATAGSRVSATKVVALAADEAYHARRHNVDPLKAFAYRDAPQAAAAAAASGRRAGGGGGGGRSSSGGRRPGGGRGGSGGRGGRR